MILSSIVKLQFQDQFVPISLINGNVSEELWQFMLWLQYRRPQFDSWVGKIRWRRDRLPTPVFLVFLCDSGYEEPNCIAGDLGSIPELEVAL